MPRGSPGHRRHCTSGSARRAWESVTAIHERALAGARDALGEERYAADFAVGRQQSAEDAVAPLDGGPAVTAL